MAQIVIFAPSGEDVSAGEQALKDAGHDVEVVEATAENLLHMAIGMIGGEDEKPAEEEPAEEEPAEEEPAEEEPAEEEPTKMESLGNCSIDGEMVPAFLGKKTRLFVKELHRGEKTTFTINESVISTWEKKHRFFLTTESGRVLAPAADVYRSKFGQTYLEVGPELSKFF